jgi:hypothetical protein
MPLLSELTASDTAANSLPGKSNLSPVIKTLKNAGNLGTPQDVLDSVNRLKFEAIFDSYMRTLFAILGLLLCLIATRAEELPVIKDS